MADHSPTLVLDVLDEFCYPVSPFWWRDNTSCELCHVNQSLHDEVDLSECFEDTAILYSLSLMILLVLLMKCVCRRYITRPEISFNYLNVAKMLLCVAVICTSVIDLSYTIYQQSTQQGTVAYYQFISPIVTAMTMVMASVLIFSERKAGVRSSGYLTIFWLSVLVYGSIKLRTLVLVSLDSEDGVHDVFRFATFCIQLVVYVIQFILVLIPEPKSMYTVLRTDERDPCPEETVSFLSRITWWWLNRLFWQGFKSPLVFDDLSDLRDSDKSDVIVRRFEEEWNKRLARAKRHTDDSVGVATGGRSQELSLVMALVHAFGRTFLIGGIFKLFQDLLGFASPQILRLLINYVNDPNEPGWKGYFYTALLFIVAVAQSILLQQYFYRCFVTGMRIRTAVIAVVYKKALVLSNSARRTSTVGEIVNLMSVDAQRLLDLMTYLHMIWSAPFQILLSLVFLYQAMGPSIFAGFILMAMVIPVNVLIFIFSSKYQTMKMAKKDARMKLVNELLDGIKVIKLYAWEIPFKGLVSSLRLQELKYLKATSYLSSGSSFIWTCAPFLVATVTFTTYSLIHQGDPDNTLTADKVFVALSLFYLLQFPLYFLPMLTSEIVQSRVSIKRLCKYLYSSELDHHGLDMDTHTYLDGSGLEMSPMDSISVVDGSFTWDELNSPTLQEINFSVKPGELIAVVGQVGAGKSSLISALLGDMEKINGDTTIRGQVAYVPQQAWIQNATVKDNILFGKLQIGTLYDQTLHACALEPDLEILPGGDMTEIGEKGINLSGGQKQRVSLARSVYQEADIYLLDDPLSAVDSHVGKHIFDNVIGPDGMLRRKCRVLVTHSVTVLPQCDRILVIDHGRITEMGSYDELVSKENGKFADFLQSYAKKIEQDNDDDRSGQSNSNNKIKKSSSNKEQSSSSALTGEETAESGSVRLSVVLAYIKSCTWSLTVVTVLSYTVYLGVSVGQNFWLAHWSNMETVHPNNTHLTVNLSVYSLLGGVKIITIVIATLTLVTGTIAASSTLHSNMLANILRAPMAFFDTTPIGRILNRFSKDIDNIDEKLTPVLVDFFITLTDVLAAMIVISIASPWFITMIIPLAVLYLFIQRFYVATSRQLNRLQSISQSPIFSHFRETITGASSIRAYRQTQRFTDTSQQLVDYNNIANFPIICGKRWLAIRLEFIGNLIILFAAMFATLQRNYAGVFGSINSGLAGLSISYAIQITQSFNWVVRTCSELESAIVAVERVKEYSETQTEADDVIADHRPPDNWPDNGCIQFNNYSTQYRSDLKLVLEDVQFNISSKQKVGIVGRTGAGKSSLTLALFRIIESAGGSILIDGIDIGRIGLRDLRSRITIIPQDPVLFSGTLRVNLDPFNYHTDDEIWFALQTAHLSQFVNSLEAGLEHEISEGGENISVGQRQLVCLARALLRKTKILVLDEATAAVDMETDDLIQKTIRKEFADATVITIAHRLNTIMDYDKILVLDNGRIAEFDSPNRLLEDKGVFYGMAKDANLV